MEVGEKGLYVLNFNFEPTNVLKQSAYNCIYNIFYVIFICYFMSIILYQIKPSCEEVNKWHTWEQNNEQYISCILFVLINVFAIGKQVPFKWKIIYLHSVQSSFSVQPFLGLTDTEIPKGKVTISSHSNSYRCCHQLFKVLNSTYIYIIITVNLSFLVSITYYSAFCLCVTVIKAVP